ncbi:MAG: PPOX class F420-dependent oxidoreductase [Thermoleophilia bacterium]|nr:PPOX class F420-dependent oxidoreductase [Thermoleophilia bacterium]
MARRMDESEARQFLSRGTRTGKLAVTRRDGAPMVVPVWFVVDDDGSLLFTTWKGSVKGRALARDGRASLCVDMQEPPYAYVRVDGRVHLSEDLDEMRAWATRIGERYMGADRAEEFGARNAVTGEMLVRLRPEHVVAQDDITA